MGSYSVESKYQVESKGVRKSKSRRRVTIEVHYADGNNVQIMTNMIAVPDLKKKVQLLSSIINFKNTFLDH